MMKDWLQRVEVDLRLTYPTGGVRDDNWARLTITDRASGMQVLEVDISGDDLAGLLATRGVTVAADVLMPSHYERVGKRYEHVKFDLPEHLRREAVRVNGQTYPTDAVKEWAEKSRPQMDGPEWIGPSYYMHNYGWAVTWARWV